MKPTGFQRFVKAFCEIGAVRLLMLAREIFENDRIELGQLTDKQVRLLAGELSARWKIGEPQTEIKVCPLCCSAFAPGPETARLCNECFAEVLSAESERYDRAAKDAGEAPA